MTERAAALPPLRAALVRIVGADSALHGMGLYLGNGEVVTCAHVVASALDLPSDAGLPDKPVRLDFPLLAPGEITTAEVVSWQPELPDGSGDVAGLRLLSPPPAHAIPAVLARTPNTAGHSFLTFGFRSGRADPKGVGVWVRGEIRGSVLHGWVQLGAADDGLRVERGFSGSPVWDQTQAQIIGLIRAVDTGRDRTLAYALPTETVLSAWPALAARVRAASPFRMLQPFDESSAEHFHGRDALTADVERRVTGSIAHVVSGASGAGKSSLLQAGLAPRLRARDDTFPVVCRPAAEGPSSPWPALLATAMVDALVRWEDDDAGDSLSALRELPSERAAYTDRLASMLAGTNPADAAIHLLQEVRRRSLVLILDQFEDVQQLRDDLRQGLLDALVRLAEPPRTGVVRVRVVLGVRADATEWLRSAGLPSFGETVVGPLGEDQLREAIEAPIRDTGLLHFEDRLVGRILDDLHEQPYCLPLLQAILQQLWDTAPPDGMLSHRAYDELIRGAGPIGASLERIWQEQLQPGERALLAELALHLAVPLDPGGFGRRICRREELPPGLWSLSEALATTRLLVLGGRDVETVEFAHDALFQQWPRLREILDGDREFLGWRTGLRPRLVRWVDSARSSDHVLSGDELAEAVRWRTERADSLAPPETELIEASLRFRRSVRRSLAAVAALVAVTLVGICALGGLAAVSLRARRTGDDLEKSRTIAVRGAGLPDRARAYFAVTAARTGDSPHARAYLGEIWRRFHHVESSFPGVGGTASANGRTVLSSTRGRTRLHVWSLPAGAVSGTRHVELPVSGDAAAVSGDGRRVAVIEEDGSLSVWEAPFDRATTRWPAPSLLARESPEGTTMALNDTGSLAALVHGGYVQVVRLTDGAPRGRPVPVPPAVRDMLGSTHVAVGPDGRRVFLTTRTPEVGSSRVDAHLLDTERATVTALPDGLQVARVTDEGRRVLTCRQTLDGNGLFATYAATDLTTGATGELLTIRRRCGPPVPVPGRNQLALATSNTATNTAENPAEPTFEIYDLGTRENVAGFALPEYAAEFDSLWRLDRRPDESLRLTIETPGGLVTLGLPGPNHLDYALSSAEAAGYDPTGTTMLLSANGRWSAWDVRSGRRTAAGPAPAATPLAVVGDRTFSPDGTLLATVSSDLTYAEIWDTRTLRRASRVALPPNPVPSDREGFRAGLRVRVTDDARLLVLAAGSVFLLDPDGRVATRFSLADEDVATGGVLLGPRTRTVTTIRRGDGEIRVWDLDRLVSDRRGRIPGWDDRRSADLELSESESRLVVIGDEVLVWDLDDERAVEVAQADEGETPIGFLEDPDRLVLSESGQNGVGTLVRPVGGYNRLERTVGWHPDTSRFVRRTTWPSPAHGWRSVRPDAAETVVWVSTGHRARLRSGTDPIARTVCAALGPPTAAELDQYPDVLDEHTCDF